MSVQFDCFTVLCCVSVRACARSRVCEYMCVRSAIRLLECVLVFFFFFNLGFVVYFTVIVAAIDT